MVYDYLSLVGTIGPHDAGMRIVQAESAAATATTTTAIVTMGENRWMMTATGMFVYTHFDPLDPFDPFDPTDAFDPTDPFDPSDPIDPLSNNRDKHEQGEQATSTNKDNKRQQATTSDKSTWLRANSGTEPSQWNGNASSWSVRKN